MSQLTLRAFLRRCRPYERWQTPFAPQLRHSVVLSSFVTSLTLAAWWYLPALLPLAEAPIFLVLRHQEALVLELLIEARLGLIALNVCGLALLAPLVWSTAGLRIGRLMWHWVALAQVFLGLVSGLVLLASVLLFVAINAILWAALVAAGCGLLWAMLLRRSR